jgi:hypothetical protein
VAQVVEFLPSKHEVLNSKPNDTKKKKINHKKIICFLVCGITDGLKEVREACTRGKDNHSKS